MAITTFLHTAAGKRLTPVRPTLRTVRVGHVAISLHKARPTSVHTEQVARAFRKIASPANASLFTAEAALAAFDDVEV